MNRRSFARLLTLAGATSLIRASAYPTAPVGSLPRFSCMLWALERQSTFDQAVEAVAAAGYQGIELVGEPAKWSASETQRVMARMRSLNLVFDAMSGVKAGFAVPAQSNLFLAQLGDLMRNAKQLNCPQIILLSGDRVDGLDPTQQTRTAAENLKRASDMAAKEAIELVIEPIDRLENPRMFLTSVTDAFELVRSIHPPNLKVLYDFYHEQRGFGNLIEKLETNIDWVGLVHVADVPGRHEPGTGEIDYPTIYRRLAELRYSRYIAMEFYPTRPASLTLRAARTEALTAFQ